MTDIFGFSMMRGTTTRCNLCSRTINRRGRRHGQSGTTRTRLYTIWCGMRQRCNNPTSRRYADWGGRGIKICKRWAKFEQFAADMGQPPTDRHSIDRYPNPDGNYSPSNCRWATPKQQANNRRPKQLHSK